MNERLLTLDEAARLRPAGRSGRPAHVSTIYRWVARGIRGVRLEAIRIGGRLYTSMEALQQFAERLTLGCGDAATSPPVASSAARRRSAERAERMLDRLGI